MADVWLRLSELWRFDLTGLINVIDVLLVAYLIFRLLKLIRGTRAWRVFFGVLFFVAALFLSDYFELRTLHWILDKATLLAPVALVILFLPELRQAVEGFAKLGFWPGRFIGADPDLGASAQEEVIAAVTEMAEQRIGALIVLERGTKLDDIAANGVPVNATLSAPLLGTIFYPGSPLHDGAAIVRNNQLLAAACRLPYSDNTAIDPHFHMRHRAGLGISEQSDCVVVVVSEERGAIAVAVAGRMIPTPTVKDLRDVLSAEMRGFGDGGGDGRPRRLTRRVPSNRERVG